MINPPTPSPVLGSDMDKEIAVMSRQGVKILQRGTLECEEGEIQYVFFDTFNTGRYILGLSYNSGQKESYAGVNKNDMRFSQVAFAVKCSPCHQILE